MSGKSQCPNCGRPFQKISASGRAGFCEYHKRWFAMTPDASAEAEAANREYARLKEEEKERARAARQAEEAAARRKAFRRRMLVLLGLLLVLAGAGGACYRFWFLSSRRYDEAVKLMTDGQYDEAGALFAQNGSFSRSAELLQLCEILEAEETGASLLPLEDREAAQVLAEQGQAFMEKEPDFALRCMQAAYDLTRTSEAAQRLAEAYTARAEQLEKDGAARQALEYREKAFDLTGREEDLIAFLEKARELDRQQKEQGTEGLWEAAMEKYAAEMDRFGISAQEFYPEAGEGRTLEAGTPKTGVFEKDSAAQVYRLELKEEAALTLHLSWEGGAGGETLCAGIAGPGEEDRWIYGAAELEGSREEAVSPPLYLPGGEYEILVEGSLEKGLAEYRLEAEISPKGNSETEPNDMRESANALTPGEALSASVGKKGDTDWYSFELEGNSLICPELSFEALASPSDAYQLTVFREDQPDPAVTFTAGGHDAGKHFEEYALPGGRYLLKVENPARIPQAYQLTLRLLSADAVEAEPNDRQEEAGELPPGMTVTGALGSREDVDYFKMTLEEETAGTLLASLRSETQGTGGLEIVLLSQHGRQLWPARDQGGNTVDGVSRQTEQSLVIPPGEYYWKIGSTDWSGSAAYELSFGG